MRMFEGCELSPVAGERDVEASEVSGSDKFLSPEVNSATIISQSIILMTWDVLTDSKRRGKKVECAFLVGYFTFVVIDTSHRCDLPNMLSPNASEWRNISLLLEAFSMHLKKIWHETLFFFERGKSVFIEFVSNRNRQTCSETRAADENSNELRWGKKPAPWWQKH